MPSFVKIFTAALMLTLFVGAYSSRHNNIHSCFQCMDEKVLKRCFNKMMGNMAQNFSFTPLNHGFEKKSLSPWEYKDDIDEKRYPEKIETADCDKKACPGKTSNQQIRVLLPVFLRELCNKTTNFHRLKMVPYEVAVGCTCV